MARVCQIPLSSPFSSNLEFVGKVFLKRLTLSPATSSPGLRPIGLPAATLCYRLDVTPVASELNPSVLRPSIFHFSIPARSLPRFMGSGMHRLGISTVAIKPAAGTQFGVGSTSGREILVQHLLVKEDQLELLVELQRRITQEREDLSDLAAEYSACPSKSEGGMLGWLQRGQTVPEFERASFEAPLNKVVRVKTKHGWHLLQVLDEREARFLQQLSAEEFHEHTQDPDFLTNSQLMDVREPSEISIAAIKGFEPFPLSQFGQWAPSISDDLDPQKNTYVLCHHGMRSMTAAQWLQSQGFHRLYNIVGGIHAYSQKVDNTIPTY